MPLPEREPHQIHEHTSKFGVFSFAGYEESPTYRKPIQSLKALSEYFAGKVNAKGALLSAFTEAEYLTEALDPSAIKTVAHEDVTSKHFVDWFFKLEDWVADGPDEFPYYLITNGEYLSVYGYFNGNHLDALICVAELDDCYEISFFCVNKDYQHQGIGQCLFQYVLNKFTDKKLTLDVRMNNTSALHIYKKYGFKSVAIAFDKEAPYYVMEREKDTR